MTIAERAARIEAWYLRGAIHTACETLQVHTSEICWQNQEWARAFASTIKDIASFLRPMADDVSDTAAHIKRKVDDAGDDDDEPWRRSLRDD